MKGLLPKLAIVGAATLILLAGALIIQSLDHAVYSERNALGGSAHIECWSGGVKIFDDHSLGAIRNETYRDGRFFKSKVDGFFKEVPSNCVITYDLGEMKGGE